MLKTASEGVGIPEPPGNSELYMQTLSLTKLVSCPRAHFIDKDTESRDGERESFPQVKVERVGAKLAQDPPWRGVGPPSCLSLCSRKLGWLSQWKCGLWRLQGAILHQALAFRCQ